MVSRILAKFVNVLLVITPLTFIDGIAFKSVLASPADLFGVQRSPLQPTLSVNNNTKLCSSVLEGAKSAFKSSLSDMDVIAEESKRFRFLKWSSLTGLPNERGKPFIGRQDLDLDGNGTKQVVIYRTTPFNWRGNLHYAYIFQNLSAFNAIKDQVTNTWNSSDEKQKANLRELGAQEFYPTSHSEDGSPYQTGDEWAEPALFKWNEQFFFFYGHTSSDRRFPVDIKLFQLHAKGTVDEICRVTLEASKKIYSKFVLWPGVASFLNEIRRIGSAGPDCGSRHTAAEHDDQARATEMRAAIRPWAVSAAISYSNSRPSYYVYDDRTEAFLIDWSLQEIWSRREYQTLLAHVKPAENVIATYFSQEFGVVSDRAQVNAAQVVKHLIGSRLLIPDGYDTPSKGGSTYFSTNPYTVAVLTRNRETLNDLLNPLISDRQDISSHESNSEKREKAGKALSNSVEWLYGLTRLIEAGVDVNDANRFNKTPLMVAAHMDRPDAVRILLQSGASVTRKTTSIHDYCGDGPQIGDRTALMYAAENASPIVMKILLEAGSDLNAKDSKGNGMDFYLAKNPRLSENEAAMGILELSKISNQFTGPSFNCEQAKTPPEKTICDSEVLRLFDFQIARAYGQLREIVGPPIVAEQREWLARRNTTCRDTEDKTDCLAELMRTRVRYLHNRVNERMTTK